MFLIISNSNYYMKSDTNEKTSVLYKLRQQASNKNLRPRAKETVDFFIKQIKKLRTPMRKSPGFEKDKELIPVNRLQSGMVAYFAYEAETEYPKLPYYDTYPLSCIINVWVGENGKAYFDGINFHYLPIPVRFRVMEKIVKRFAFWNMDNESNKFISFSNYYQIRDILQSEGFGFAYKKYLLSNVRSSLLQVPLKHLDIAINLPLSKWSGASDEAVWSDYIKKTLSGG